MNNIVKKIWKTIIAINYFIITKLPMVIILFIGLFYTRYLFINVSEDTTIITNIAFGIVVSLSALSFSCSRAILDSKKDKELFQFAGEKLFHSGLMLITASKMKYTLLEIKVADNFNWLIIVIEYIVPILFIFAMFAAHGGFIINNKLLWKRFHRFSDWDNFF